jgi:hypothetical protein
MFTATVGYTDKGSEHVHEHWWESDTTGCPSASPEESDANGTVIPRGCRGLCRQASDQAGVVESPLYPLRYGFKNIEKGISSVQTDQSNAQQKCSVK